MHRLLIHVRRHLIHFDFQLIQMFLEGLFDFFLLLLVVCLLVLELLLQVDILINLQLDLLLKALNKVFQLSHLPLEELILVP